MTTTPTPWFTRNLELLGYHDLGGKPAFKLAMQEVNGRWYLYMGHLWHRGWSILDVTDPAAPQCAAFIPGPENSWTIQIQVAAGKMITALERIAPGWGEGGGRGEMVFRRVADLGPLRPGQAPTTGPLSNPEHGNPPKLLRRRPSGARGRRRAWFRRENLPDRRYFGSRQTERGLPLLAAGAGGTRGQERGEIFLAWSGPRGGKARLPPLRGRRSHHPGHFGRLTPEDGEPAALSRPVQPAGHPHLSPLAAPKTRPNQRRGDR